MVVILQTVLVAHNLPIQLVHQLVYCRIQIFMRAFSKHVVPFDVDIALGTLASFLFLLLLNSKEHLDIDDLVKMPHDSI